MKHKKNKMRSRYFLGFIYFLILGLVGCENRCWFKGKSSPSALILTYNKEDGTPLLLEDNMKDSFQLHSTINTDTLYVFPRTSETNLTLVLQLENVISGAEYYLELTDTDIDTIQIAYDLTVSKCNKNYRINSLNYNDTSFTPSFSVNILK